MWLLPFRNNVPTKHTTADGKVVYFPLGCKCLRNTLLDHSFKRHKQSPHLLVSKLPCQEQVRDPTGLLSNSSKSSPINGPTRASLLLNACLTQVPGKISFHKRLPWLRRNLTL